MDGECCFTEPRIPPRDNPPHIIWRQTLHTTPLATPLAFLFATLFALRATPLCTDSCTEFRIAAFDGAVLGGVGGVVPFLESQANETIAKKRTCRSVAAYEIDRTQVLPAGGCNRVVVVVEKDPPPWGELYGVRGDVNFGTVQETDDGEGEDGVDLFRSFGPWTTTSCVSKPIYYT